MIHTQHMASPVGRILLAERAGALIGLWVEKQTSTPAPRAEETVQAETPLLITTKDWLARYFAGERPSVSELPLSPAGGDFRQTVWEILCKIPYGETTTYGEIAKAVASRMGMPRMSAQAIGGAVGHNPISIIIPCHRVVGANGSLTGYAGGIGLKVALLTHEGVDMSRLFVPKTGTKL